MHSEGKRVYENISPHAFLNQGGGRAKHSTSVAFSDRQAEGHGLSLPTIRVSDSVEVKRGTLEQKQVQVRGNLNLKSSQSSKTIEVNDENERMPNVSRFETEG
jgi:hypothetical protein